SSKRDWSSDVCSSDLMNDNAYMREPITVDDVLNSRWITEPLHLLDCCLVTDGGGAVIVTSKQVAKKTQKKPVWILGHGETHTHRSEERRVGKERKAE